MRHKILLMMLLCVTCIGADPADYADPLLSPAPPEMHTSLIEQTAPDFAFSDVQRNKVHHMSDFKDKTVMVSFWTAWCRPCRHESRVLLELARAHPDNSILVMMSEDNDDSRAHDMAQSITPQANVYISWDRRRTIQNFFHAFRYPESIILPPGGQAARKITGGLTYEDEQALAAALH